MSHETYRVAAHETDSVANLHWLMVTLMLTTLMHRPRKFVLLYMYTRTHAHAHARTHARTHAHAHTHTHIHTHTHKEMHMHARTHDLNIVHFPDIYINDTSCTRIRICEKISHVYSTRASHPRGLFMISC